NADLDNYFEQASVNSDPAIRKRHFAAIQRILAAELPVIPLVAIDQFTITNKRVRNHATLSDGVYGGFADVWMAPN
ncbi:MAG: ABC transporter substrate-binding protein, partial [Betaproteobacteria bacterium]